MPICPVCEHSQPAGDECERCGRKLSGAPPGPPVTPLPGLEPTLAERVEVPAERLPDLEPTRLQAGADAPPEDASAWIEADRAPPVGEIAPDAIPGLEHHRAEPVPDDGEQARQGPQICRYCRTEAMPGDRFCGRCGMRLPRFDPVRVAAQERGDLVCRDCGAMGEGPRCRRCGARMVSPA
jgi:hypothetical protein